MVCRIRIQGKSFAPTGIRPEPKNDGIGNDRRLIRRFLQKKIPVAWAVPPATQVISSLEISLNPQCCFDLGQGCLFLWTHLLLAAAE
jgi:hypothetical protein